MVKMKVRTKADWKRILRKARRANIENLGHGAASIRLTARRSIRRSDRKSAPGRPPHTKGGQLKRAIFYSVDKARQRAIIGPAYTIVGQSAAAHEHGGRYKGQRFQRRPFMGPALEAVRPKLPRLWAASVR